MPLTVLTLLLSEKKEWLQSWIYDLQRHGPSHSLPLDQSWDHVCEFEEIFPLYFLLADVFVISVASGLQII